MVTTYNNLQRWVTLFFLGNIFFLWLIGLNYISLSSYSWLPVELTQLSWRFQTFSIFYLIVTYLSHLAGLNCLLLLLFIPGTVLLQRTPRLIYFLAVLSASLGDISLFADTITYNLYHFHLNNIIWRIIGSDLHAQYMGETTQEICSLALVFMGIVITNTSYAIWLKKYFIAKTSNAGKWMVILLAATLYLSYMSLIFATKNDAMLSEFKNLTRFLPFYNTVVNLVTQDTSKICLLNNAYIVPLMQNKARLHYPLHPLQDNPVTEKFNIVIIAIDAWRYDMLNKTIMPQTERFSQTAATFTRHFSGGNATLPGILSLFYSLPGTYWGNISVEHKSPVLIQELLKNHYQTGIFASASFDKPDFRDVIFSEIKNIPATQYGKTPFERDRQITDAFKEFIETAVKKPEPFFSFLFYDGAHSYCSYSQDLSPLKPVKENCNRTQYNKTRDTQLYLNRYKNSLMLIDTHIHEVLTTLTENHLLDKTIVIITSDHGEEFDDNHMGYLGHTSNYTAVQVHVPLIIYWPNAKPAVYTHTTSHYDIAPTLMRRLFNNKNPPTDYSLGKDIYDQEARPYIVVGSYLNWGIIEPKRILNIEKNGSFALTDDQLHTLPLSQLNLNVLKSALSDLNHYY